ncbi:MAG: S1 RNA-binding domain-containing protein [Acidimicrobiales bacterium]|nr:S1 RNA-binding domain-containing protein [Acidimicrobiales bacterium]
MSDPPDVTEEPAVVAVSPTLGDAAPIDASVDLDSGAPAPATAEEPVVAEEPVAAEEPVVAEEPVAAAEPKVAEAQGSPAGQPPPTAKAAPAQADSAPVQTAPLIEVPGGTLPPIEEHAPLVMQILGGIVTAVTNKEVDLVLDDGREAVIHRENFDLAETDPTTVLQVGDGAEGAVLSREDPRNRVVLSRKWVLRDRAWKKATDSIEDHSTINCRVTAASKKGVVVDVMGLRGFVPLNHFQLSSQPPPPETVGQMVELRVLAADRQKDRLLLSRRSALMKEQRKADAEALQSLKVGGTYTGTVNELTAFGAFVTVNGVRGLLHVSEMSWDRVTSPKGLVKVGQEIDVQVIEVKPKKRRVSFSRKALLDDPMAGIEVGSVHTGTVKRLVDYGVFVDIGPAEGMVHLSELAEYRPQHPSEVVLRGDEVQVKVLKVNREKRRLELSVRQALYFPA